MDREEILQLIQEEATRIATEMIANIPEKVPWVNSPLLNAEVSILNYNTYETRISTLESDVADHETRITALEP